jgi:hypothetical protein
MVAPGVSETLRPFIRIVVVFGETHNVPLPGMPTVGVLYLRTVNLYRSCVRPRWLAQETPGFRVVQPPRSNTLRPISSCRVPVLELFVVRVTNLSGEGVESKSLGCECSVRQPL